LRLPLPTAAETFRVEAAGVQIECRLPNSADLIAVARDPGVNPRNTLLQRCVQADLSALPAAAIDDVVRTIAESDPQADVQISLVCPACQHEWPVTFDIVAYLWDEVDEWAERLLHQIHRLAASYGWSERDILALSSWRRQRYLEMIEA
jgi:hypothetical protein